MSKLSRFLDRAFPRYNDTAHAGRPPEKLSIVAGRMSAINPSLTGVKTDCVFVDISKWQGNVDFVRMKVAGVKGVIMKAGQGTAIDPRFEANYVAARAAGLLVGMYWYFDSRVSPFQQAKTWAILVNKYGFDLVCVFDYEENYGGDFGGVERLEEFVTQFQAFTGVEDKDIVIYTGFFYWVDKGSQSTFWRRFKLWIAWYGKAEDVRIPAPWRVEDVWGWQFTDHGDGIFFGVQSFEIDLNYFVKGLEEFERLYGETGDVPPPTGEEGMYRVWSDTHNMSLRTGAFVGANPNNWIVTVPRGTSMQADSIIPPASGGIPGDKWAHVTRVVVAGREYSGYVAVVHNGEALCQTETIVEGTNPSATLTFVDRDGATYEGTAELKPK